MSWKRFVTACLVVLLLTAAAAAAQHTDAAEAVRKNLLFALVKIDGYGEVCGGD